jgi:thioredoxin reductase
MDSWLTHMPAGMMLKSEGFASDIYDPASAFMLRQFCAERGIPYADTGVLVSLDTFCAYGLAFQRKMLPELENRLVTGVDRHSEGFLLRLDDGETLVARRVVLAVGITHFKHIPPVLAHLPAELLSHSSRHRDLEPFRGRKVVVMGGGSSAMDVAGLLHNVGADVQLATRRKELKFPPKPTGKPRSTWQKIRHPESGLGNGIRRWFLCDAPLAFHYLPEALRLWTVRKALGPAGGWFSKDMVIGKVPLLLEHTLQRAEAADGIAHLHFRTPSGDERTVTAEHVFAATGYKVAIDRLNFVSKEIRSALKKVEETPVLSANFESSISGLYFVGVAAANSFGPVMRFACGARFTATQVSSALIKSLARR